MTKRVTGSFFTIKDIKNSLDYSQKMIFSVFLEIYFDFCSVVSYGKHFGVG